MNAPLITSSQNPKLKNACALRDSRDRRKHKKFLIDGMNLIQRAIAAGCSIEQLFLLESDSPRDNGADDVPSAISSIEQYRVAPSAMEKLQYGDRSLDAIAVAQAWSTSVHTFEARLASAARKVSQETVLVLDRMEKPGNLGAALRTADAAGVAAVFLSDPICDVFNPNAVRASLGALFTVPIVTGTQEEISNWLVSHAYSVFTARVEGSVEYSAVSYPVKTAFVLGNEADGLAERWQHADFQGVSIPMLGEIDSLNVSVSSSILLYEFLRQYRAPK